MHDVVSAVLRHDHHLGTDANRTSFLKLLFYPDVSVYGLRDTLGG
jgi:hypothetical protein